MCIKSKIQASPPWFFARGLTKRYVTMLLAEFSFVLIGWTCHILLTRCCRRMKVWMCLCVSQLLPLNTRYVMEKRNSTLSDITFQAWKNSTHSRCKKSPFICLMTASIYLWSVEEGNSLCFDSNDGSDYGGSWSQFLFVDLKSGENEKVQYMSQAKRIMSKEYRAIKTCKGI